jgi:hypothetical protein
MSQAAHNSGEAITPKALTNSSPMVGAQRQPWGYQEKEDLTLKALAHCHASVANAFSVETTSLALPGLSLRSNRWAGISERLRRYSQQH